MFPIKRLWIDRDKNVREKWKNLLNVNDLYPDDLVDYTIGIYDGSRLIGTASTYQNIIKFVAICGDYQEHNLLTQLITTLTNYLWDKGETQVFLYTKPESSKYFASLGFKMIVESNSVCLMERGTPTFDDYAKKLEKVKVASNHNGGIVMNANPFTKGHLYLVESALKQCKHLFIFVLSDDSSEFSFDNRFKLVKEGTAHLNNVTVIPSGPYQVSQATFPSYFLKERAEEEVAVHQAELDALLFKNRIASILDIEIRFVGEEPLSRVTEIYNEAMAQTFGDDIKLVIIPRLEADGNVISATHVRKAFKEKDFDLIKSITPPTTYEFLVEKSNLR